MHKRIYLPLLLLLSSLQAHAQRDPIPHPVTPAIPGVVAGGLPIERVAGGFDGSEGPLGLPDGSLLFTETRANRVIRINPDKSHEVYLENSNGANGLGLNRAGELLAVQVAQPRVGIIAPANKVRTLADNFEAVAFTRPNDLVVDSRGGAYFTDSGNNPAQSAAHNAELQATTGVYYVSPKGELRQLDNDVARPNGIQLSPDEKTLYVANTLGQHVLAYEIRSAGKVGKRREFAALAGWQETESGGTSGADGLAVDSAGNLYVASNAGVEIFSADGKALGVIPLPVKPQNLAFAGANRDQLYIVGRGEVYRLRVLTHGPAERAK